MLLVKTSSNISSCCLYDVDWSSIFYTYDNPMSFRWTKARTTYDHAHVKLTAISSMYLIHNCMQHLCPRQHTYWKLAFSDWPCQAMHMTLVLYTVNYTPCRYTIQIHHTNTPHLYTILKPLWCIIIVCFDIPSVPSVRPVHPDTMVLNTDDSPLCILLCRNYV